jgi:octaprenyl-diphosphate synthase
MTTTAAATVTDIHHLVKADFDQVNALIEENLYSHIELISAVSQHIIHSGGKRLRPLVTLLSARALGYSGQDHVRLAVVIEFLHTATLLHDDVVDGSTLRRGRQTANVVWGNSASVLVGDFLYSRAFQLMTLLGSLPIYTILANATNTIAQGEVLQLIRRHKVDLSLQDYLDVIRCKTAMLFAAATESGAVVAGASAAIQQALSAYGLHLGVAFQMIDDWLDYAVTADDSGKNPGDDLVEGKVTLPLIYAMQKATSAEQQFIRDTLQHGKAENLPAILDILKTTNAGHYVQQDAQAQADLAKQALAGLADTPHKQALVDLADLAVQRRS